MNDEQHTHTHTVKLLNRIHWHAGCWREAASPRSRWPCCSWRRGSFRAPSPWLPSWPSRPRCASGCWASLEPQRTPPARRNQTAGKQWARCRWPWRRTLWATPKPRRCTQRTETAPRGCLEKTEDAWPCQSEVKTVKTGSCEIIHLKLQLFHHPSCIFSSTLCKPFLLRPLVSFSLNGCLCFVDSCNCFVEYKHQFQQNSTVLVKETHFLKHNFYSKNRQPYKTSLKNIFESLFDKMFKLNHCRRIIVMFASLLT